jgi:hypothetical protein
MLKKSLKDFYPTSESNGYGLEKSFKRFNFLKGIDFNSVLDVGSGPCLLHQWLIKHQKNVVYEAVDIREDSTKLCNCKTYTSIPQNGLYELVCLFGTVTFNINHDENENKKILKLLISDCINKSSKYVVLTVFKDLSKKIFPHSINKLHVRFSKEEIFEMFIHEKIKEVKIHERDDLDRDEYFVIAKVD